MKNKWSLQQCETDNRDDNTTEIVLPDGNRLTLTREDCKWLITNMEENSEE